MQNELTRDLRDLARLAGAEETDDLLRRGLDWLGRLAPYDLACMFELRGGRLHVRMARGRLADERVRKHSLELSKFPTVLEALETRRARAYLEEDHAHGDGDPFDGVLDLPDGHSCMVVPLCAGDRCFGVITLDRAECIAFEQEVVDLVEIYAQLLAIALVNEERRERAEARARLLESELHPGELHDAESDAPAMRELSRRLLQVAPLDTPVLILGETGTGKERVARAVHDRSRRSDRPFVKINCAAIPAGLLESELFGHVKGAFTGATTDRAGRFQTADGGTLLLDEIGELPLELQAKLLRVLQEGTFEPVGADRTVRVDVRIVAATHVNLEQAIAEKKFREDLFYRLAVFPLQLPPLRERLEDLPRLCAALLEDLAARTGRRGLRVDDGALALLRTHDWPGNVRELGNVLERAAILTPDELISASAIELPGRRANTFVARRVEAAPLTLDEAMRAHIEVVLERTSGRIYGKGGAAELLGVPPSTLQSRMKRLGL